MADREICEARGKMSDWLSFWSHRESLGVLPEFGQDVVKREPMVFSARHSFAYTAGGPITRAFLRSLPKGWKDSIIDSRTHMLMPGWYPCIPGWHLDDVPRTRPDGQPDHSSPIYKAEHVMAVVGDSSLTEFIEGPLHLQDVPVGGGVVYGKWHRDIEKILLDATHMRQTVQDREVIAFNWQTFHRGVAVSKNGWRFFIRATRNTDRKFVNELRTQVQVYLPAMEAGW